MDLPEENPRSPVEAIGVRSFRGRALPLPARLAGYSALIDRFQLRVPLHHEMAAVSLKNSRRKEDGWAIYPATHFPGDGVVDHLVFALKYEGVQLLTLKKIFEAFEPNELGAAIRARPTSAYLRRLCFFYEWLTDLDLDVPNVAAGGYVDALDVDQQYATKYSENVKRWRVRDNLPGSWSFCPVIFRTRRLDQFIGKDYAGQARQIVESAPRELISRAAAFLLLSDSKASFAIEGENPPKDRIIRWGSVIGKAGQVGLSADQLIKIQKELIGDDRFVRTGLRKEGGFVGRHDSFGQPEPEHISANPRDLDDLIDGLVDFDRYTKSYDLDPVLSAACLSFGFVYIHPFEDGNGRIHRFLMHHVLSERRYTPVGIVFPISSVILDDIARYKDVLEQISRPLLEWIEWTSTERGNVRVLNDTADYYRFFDATAHCEFLFKCIERTIERDLPEELAFLGHRDEFHRRATEIIDMPERTLDLMLRFLRQGHGTFSKRALADEFSHLRNDEAQRFESLYREVFDLSQ